MPDEGSLFPSLCPPPFLCVLCVKSFDFLCALCVSAVHLLVTHPKQNAESRATPKPPSPSAKPIPPAKPPQIPPHAPRKTPHPSTRPQVQSKSQHSAP